MENPCPTHAKPTTHCPDCVMAAYRLGMLAAARMAAADYAAGFDDLSAAQNIRQAAEALGPAAYATVMRELESGVAGLAVHCVDFSALAQDADQYQLGRRFIVEACEVIDRELQAVSPSMYCCVCLLPVGPNPRVHVLPPEPLTSSREAFRLRWAPACRRPDCAAVAVARYNQRPA